MKSNNYLQLTVIMSANKEEKKCGKQNTSAGLFAKLIILTNKTYIMSHDLFTHSIRIVENTG